MSPRLKNFIALRWGVIAIVIASLTAGHFFLGFDSMSATSYWVVLAYVSSNAILHVIRRPLGDAIPDVLSFTALLADLTFLTSLLLLNGGAHNPFSVLILGIASLGALMLSVRSLLIFIVACMAALWLIYSGMAGHHHDAGYSQHLRGMWLANALGIFLICGWVYYLRRLNVKMTRKNEIAQRMVGDLERMESMGRLVAEASHQLGTPLGTLQLGLSELADFNNPLNQEDQQRWHADMQHAVDRMKAIVVGLNPAFPEGSQGTRDLAEWVAAFVDHWAKPRKAVVHVASTLGEYSVREDFAEAMGNVLSALLDNALDAAGVDHPIQVELSFTKNELVLTVDDQGGGMEPGILKKAIDPLFTTKPKGTGLGLYVCRETAKKHGGALYLQSEFGKGTRVTVTFNKDSL